MATPSSLPDPEAARGVTADATSAGEEAALDELFELAVAQRERGGALDLASWLRGREQLASRARAVLNLAAEIATSRPPQLEGTGLPVCAGFEVLEEVGRGAMGIVYRAREKELHRIVALKVLAPALAASGRARERFLAEARALARVRHPHVVAVHAIAAEPELCAYAMEWIDGSTLAAAIAARDPRLDGAGVARLGIAVAEALHAVHASGLVHRDVKPSNILLRADFFPLLSDFGLVRDVEHSLHTATGEFLGTAAYASPEQLRGEHTRVDARSDVYSLGVTLYAALAGESPFGRISGTAEFLRRIEGGAAIPLARAAPRVARDLATIVETAMDRDPRRRYPSARALAEDLQRFLRCEPIAARRAGAWLRTWRWIERSPRLAAALFALFLALSGGLAVALHLLGRAETERARAELERERSEQRAYTAHLAAAEAAVRAFDFSDARQHLLAAPEGYRGWEWIYLRSKLDSSRVLARHERSVNAIAVHPSGALVATAADDGVQVVETETGSRRARIRRGIPIEGLAWSPDGAWLALTSSRALELLDGEDFALRACFELGQRGRALDFSPDGSALVLGTHSGHHVVLALSELLAVARARPRRSSPLPLALRTWDGHSAAIHRLDYGARGLVASTSTASAKVWELASGERRGRFALSENHFGVAIDPTGARVAVGANDGPIRLFEIGARSASQVLEGHKGRVMSLAWSKDGSRLVSGSYDRTVRVWNADGSLAGVLTGHLGNVQCVAFLPDGARVISAAGGEGDDSVRLWERLDVEPLRVLVPEGHRSVAVALSSTGHWYALYSSGGERLTMLRGVRGDRRFERRELAARSNVLELDVSPDGRWIAVATRDGALLYEASSWDSAFALLGSTRVPLVPVRTLPSNASRARGIRFGARGELLVGHMNGDVALWDHERGELLHHLRIPGGTAHDVELDPAGRCIAALSRKHLAIWDRASATLLHERTDLPYGGALALDPQGRRFALAVGERDPEIEIYDLELARSTALLRGPTEEITGLAFSPDGRRLAVASGDRLVRLYDAESGILTLTLRDHGYLVKSVVWSPDGNALASCGRDGILVIRETEPLTPTPR